MSRRLGLFTGVLILFFSSGAGASTLQQRMREVERLRGLTFTRDVKQRTVDRSELRALIQHQLINSVPYALDDYVEILKALQLIDRSTPDVIKQMLDLYESQVLAFYDPLTHTYFAVRQLPESIAGLADTSVLEESVVMHELVHALQDQRFQAAERDRALLRDTDGELAYHALLEGEASLVMLQYLLVKNGQSFDDAVKNDLLIGAMTSAVAADKSVDAAAPRYFVESLKFPYLDGLKLVIEGYRRGGWKAIDRMHANPPRSTREVLHRSEYFARLDRGLEAAPPFEGSPPAGTLTVEHLGEFHWRFLVGDQARGWVDDRVTIVQNSACEPTVTVETRWENSQKAAAFRDAYTAFLRKRGIEPFVTLDDRSVKAIYTP